MRILRFLLSLLQSGLREEEDERSLLDGSSWTGELNFRTNQFDCGTDPGGLYQDDL